MSSQKKIVSSDFPKNCLAPSCYSPFIFGAAILKGLWGLVEENVVERSLFSLEIGLLVMLLLGVLSSWVQMAIRPFVVVVVGFSGLDLEYMENSHG